jgi:hypothetical protein
LKSPRRSGDACCLGGERRIPPATLEPQGNVLFNDLL